MGDKYTGVTLVQKEATPDDHNKVALDLLSKINTLSADADASLSKVQSTLDAKIALIKDYVVDFAGTEAAGYRKYAGGWMEQWGVSGTLTTSNSSGGIFYASASLVFSQNFISVPLRQNIYLTAGAGAYLVWPGQVNAPSVGGVGAYLLGSSASATGTLGFRVWGKWQ